MAKSISAKSVSAKQKPRRPGRPSTGVTPMIGLRASPELRGAIVKWAESQPDMPKLSEAIRRLVELGLTVRMSRRPTAKVAARAEELAAEVVDKHASAEHRDTAKRRLIKGPSVFREMRKDRHK